MHSYIKPVYDQYALQANAINAAGAKAYMKNQFKFFGIKTPERRRLTKEYMKRMGLQSAKDLHDIVTELWSLEERECQYFAIELINYHQPLWKEDIIELIEFCLVTKSWWDTVDSYRVNAQGPILSCFRRQLKAQQTDGIRVTIFGCSGAACCFKKITKALPILIYWPTTLYTLPHQRSFL